MGSVYVNLMSFVKNKQARASNGRNYDSCRKKIILKFSKTCLCDCDAFFKLWEMYNNVLHPNTKKLNYR